MMAGLFLCQEEHLDRERRGYVRAFAKRGVKIVTLLHTDGTNPDLPCVLKRFPEKVSFILHPDRGVLLPEGLVEIGIPSICFHIDTCTGTQARINMSMLFDYSCVFLAGFARVFQQAGHPRPILLPHAVEAELFQETDEERIYEVGWVGQMEQSIYATRQYLLPRLAERFRMNEWRRCHTPDEMAEVYKRSKVVVNITRDDYPQGANLRVFEAMAAGALLITGVPSELTALGFREGEHFIGYRDKDEAKDLVCYYLDREMERRRIAAAGRDIVLQEHTYDCRVAKILAMLEENGGRLFAPARGWSEADVRRIYLRYYAELQLLDHLIREARRLARISPWAALGWVPTILGKMLSQGRFSGWRG